MGVVTKDGTEVMFDQRATPEGGRVVGRADGSRHVAELRDIQRVLVGHKALDKPKTAIFRGGRFATQPDPHPDAAWARGPSPLHW